MKFTNIIKLTALCLFLNTQFTRPAGENVTLTKSEVAKLKDYLIKTRDDAKSKIAEVETRLEQMREQKIDLQSDAVKAVKDEKYHFQDIIDGNSALLEQLRTGQYSYALVVAQLKSLGTNPQDALKLTDKRAALLAEEKVDSLITEIKSLNPNRSEKELNEAFLSYKVNEKVDSRMTYIVTDLLNRFFKQNSRIQDTAAVKEALGILEAWVQIFQDNPKLAKVLKSRILGDPVQRTRAYGMIDMIRKTL